MRRWICCLLGLAVLGQTGWGQSAPGTAATGLDDLKRQYEATLRETLRLGGEDVKTIHKRYADGLDRLESDLQDRGDLKDLIVLREEKKRFLAAPDIPDSAVVSEPEALRLLQAAWQEQMATQQVGQTSRILDAGAKYMRSLSALQKRLAAQANAAGVEAVKAEKDRLLDDNYIREALAAKSVASAEGPARITCYAPGKEPAVPLNALHALRLNYASPDRMAASYYYSLAVSVYSRTQGAAAEDEARGVQPQLIPRITLTAKNNELPENSKLVLEYFSHRAGDNTSGAYRREAVEQQGLPRLARGQSLVCDGDGVALAFRAATGKAAAFRGGGREFYGLIVSLFSPSGKLLFQQCTPSSLIKECTVTPPEAGP